VRTAGLRPFHLAIPVANLAAARAFYGGLLGCAEGRSDAHWIDFDLAGHQLVCHLDPDGSAQRPRVSNPVDDHAVPIPHFGVVLTMPEWHALADHLRAAGTGFVVEPHVRFAGGPGEQATLFIQDPSGNVLEFKGFADLGQLFATGTDASTGGG
jgi:extradiol dioxygenase family protein